MKYVIKPIEMTSLTFCNGCSCKGGNCNCKGSGSRYSESSKTSTR